MKKLASNTVFRPSQSMTQGHNDDQSGGMLLEAAKRRPAQYKQYV